MYGITTMAARASRAAHSAARTAHARPHSKKARSSAAAAQKVRFILEEFIVLTVGRDAFGAAQKMSITLRQSPASVQKPPLFLSVLIV